MTKGCIVVGHKSPRYVGRINRQIYIKTYAWKHKLMTPREFIPLHLPTVTELLCSWTFAGCNSQKKKGSRPYLLTILRSPRMNSSLILLHGAVVWDDRWARCFLNSVILSQRLLHLLRICSILVLWLYLLNGVSFGILYTHVDAFTVHYGPLFVLQCASEFLLDRPLFFGTLARCWLACSAQTQTYINYSYII